MSFDRQMFVLFVHKALKEHKNDKSLDSGKASYKPTLPRSVRS
jgi:hypothetical protein